VQMRAGGFPLSKAACSQLHTNKTGLLPGQGRILVQSKLELDKWTCKKKNEKTKWHVSKEEGVCEYPC
jgi:hypothetical protein